MTSNPFSAQYLDLFSVLNSTTWHVPVFFEPCVKGLGFESQRRVQIWSKTLTVPDPAAAARLAHHDFKKKRCHVKPQGDLGFTKYLSVEQESCQVKNTFLLLFQRRQTQRIDRGELSKLSTFPLSFLDGNDRQGLGSCPIDIERASGALIVVNNQESRVCVLVGVGLGDPWRMMSFSACRWGAAPISSSFQQL